MLLIFSGVFWYSMHRHDSQSRSVPRQCLSEYETALHRPRPFNLLCLNSPQLLARSRELNISPDGAVFCCRDSIVDEVHRRDSPSKKASPNKNKSHEIQKPIAPLLMISSSKYPCTSSRGNAPILRRSGRKLVKRDPPYGEQEQNADVRKGRGPLCRRGSWGSSCWMWKF
jgi:hypothetical protein